MTRSSLVLTVIGPDRPGLIEALAAVVIRFHVHRLDVVAEVSADRHVPAPSLFPLHQYCSNHAHECQPLAQW